MLVKQLAGGLRGVHQGIGKLWPPYVEHPLGFYGRDTYILAGALNVDSLVVHQLDLCSSATLPKASILMGCPSLHQSPGALSWLREIF